MYGMQISETGLFDDTSRPEPAPAESLRSTEFSFMHPDDVVSDRRLTHAEKREILASWASDVHAIPNAPALRQLDNGAVVRIDDVLRALNSLGEGNASEPTVFDPVRSFAALHFRPPRQLRSALQRNSSDDDEDPPPCPAMVAKPPSGPESGGAAAELGLALAA